jgi:hypothetical protein
MSCASSDGSKKGPSEKQRCQQNDDKSGQDAPDAASVEVQIGKPAPQKIVLNVPGDQKPGDHKEDVNADKAACKGGREGMKDND